MNMDYALASGLILVLLSIPAIIAAWANGQRFYVRLAVLAAGLLLIEWTYLSDPDRYAPGNWPDAVTRVAAKIIP